MLAAINPIIACSIILPVPGSKYACAIVGFIIIYKQNSKTNLFIKLKLDKQINILYDLEFNKYINLMRNKKFPKVSILITNYNKEKYIEKALNTSLNQTYKNFEVLIYDDGSTDRSVNLIKKYKNISLTLNKNKIKKSPPQNQISGIIKLIKRSKGKYIFFLDGDDYFNKKKITSFIKYLNKNEKIKFLQDLPILLSNNKKYKVKEKKNKFTIWPTVIPTSSICVEKKYLINFLKHVYKNKFPDLEIDARIVIYSFLMKELNIINYSYTYYRDNSPGITFKYQKFSSNWWKKRYQAFKYMFLLMKKFNLKINKGYDYYLTKIINFFIEL